MATRLADREQQRSSALPVPQALGKMLQLAWSKGVLPEPALDLRALMEGAIRAEQGALDEGSWREGLQLLSCDLTQTASLNTLGQVIAYGLIKRTLRQRIRARKLWLSHPEILDVPIPRPVIILGHMRSGTTRLHRMLACDPRFSHTRLHETLDPVPVSRPASIAAALFVRTLLNLCNPQLRSIHPTSAWAAEEEFGLHAFSFHGAMFEAQWRVPSFARWCEQRPLGEVYRDFRRLVQTLRWTRGGPADRVQLLKAPQFMQDLDAVLRAFPDARVLMLNRNRDEVVASSASLVWNQQKVQSDSADPAWAGREWARKTELRQQRADTALSSRPDVPLLHVQYADVSRDWRSQIERIYRFLGEPLLPSVANRMARVAASSKHRGHTYHSDQFGLRGRRSDSESARPCA